MKKPSIAIFLTLTVLFPQIVFAHPGSVSTDGCHFCKTNCAKWGYTYGTRHSHSGQPCNPAKGPVDPLYNNISEPATPTPVPVIIFSTTPTPTYNPTPTPTFTPTLVSTPTPTPTPLPTPMPTPTFTPLPTVIPTNSPTPTPIQSIAPTEKPQVLSKHGNKPIETRQKQIHWWRLTPFTQLAGLWFNWK